MNPSYSIQKPCTEDWGKMTTEEQGRHCLVCCKTVVDFSTKSNGEIVDFLKSNREEKVCGRFRAEQLENSNSTRAPRFTSRSRTFFAALIFVFGGMLFSSCSQNTPEHLMGDVAYIPDSTQKQFVDTTKHELPIIDTTKKTGAIKMSKRTAPDSLKEDNFLMGDVEYNPRFDSIK